MVKGLIGGSLAAALSVLSVTVCAAGRDLSAELATADALLHSRDYDQAFAEYSKFANRNPLAQFSLGLMEYYGWGRPVNHIAACQNFESASEGGIPMAQQLLADCYRLGVHAPASFTAAEQWYRQAAENGLPTANYWWGRMLIEGTVGTRDLHEGIRLCELAAGAGAIEAQLYLARNYQSGELFSPDLQRAFYWYERAARTNNAEALYQSGILMRERIPEGVAREEALHTLESAAEQGYKAAYLPTAEMYYSAPTDPETNMPTAENLAKSYLWLQATLRSTNDPEQRSRAQSMLDTVMRVMPKTWLSDLDQSVDAHFAQHPARASP